MAQIDVSYAAIKQMIQASGSFVAYVPLPANAGYEIYITKEGRDWHAEALVGADATDFENSLKTSAKQAANANEAIGFAEFGVS